MQTFVVGSSPTVLAGYLEFSDEKFFAGCRETEFRFKILFFVSNPLCLSCFEIRNQFQSLRFEFSSELKRTRL
jgi:hypothetical protein